MNQIKMTSICEDCKYYAGENKFCYLVTMNVFTTDKELREIFLKKCKKW